MNLAARFRAITYREYVDIAIGGGMGGGQGAMAQLEI